MKFLRWLLPAMLFAAPLTGQTVSVEQGDTITIRIVTGVDTVVVVNTVTDTIITPPDTVVVTNTVTDTVFVNLPPDTVFVTDTLECNCAPPPVDTVPTPNPDPDPTPDPEPIPPDTVAPPPPDTTTPPPPPAGALYQGWNFPDGSTHTQWNDPDLVGGGNAGGRGESRARTLLNPGPWGGTKVLENYYGVIPATSQPQVGTEWKLPSGISEMWLETWVRYDTSWQIGPDNPLYPGNVDHKLIFAWVRIPGQAYYPQRWECKVGPWWDTMPCSAASHDIAYDYMKNLSGDGSRLNANTAAWDGQWHRLRWHAKMGAGDGVFEVWWDDMKTIDFANLDTKSPGGYFASIQFGANRNQGTNQPMFFQFGPATIYTADPGW